MLTLYSTRYLPALVDDVQLIGIDLGPTPITQLPHTFIDENSLKLAARRSFDKIVNGILYPAGESILPDVDYTFDEIGRAHV